MEDAASMTDMDFWELIRNHCDETGATEAWIMRRAGLSTKTFTAWRVRGIPTLPKQSQILGLAEALRRPYDDVLQAILVSTGYVPEAAAVHAREVEHAKKEARIIAQSDARRLSALPDTSDATDLRAAAKEEGIEGAGEDSI